jgi:hypothetical protein
MRARHCGRRAAADGTRTCPCGLSVRRSAGRREARQTLLPVGGPCFAGQCLRRCSRGIGNPREQCSGFGRLPAAMPIKRDTGRTLAKMMVAAWRAGGLHILDVGTVAGSPARRRQAAGAGHGRALAALVRRSREIHLRTRSYPQNPWWPAGQDWASGPVPTGHRNVAPMSGADVNAQVPRSSQLRGLLFLALK